MMTRSKFDLWFWRLLPILALVVVVLVFIVEHHRHKVMREHHAIIVTSGAVTEIVTHRDAVREAGRQLKEELSGKPDSAINSKTNEAQILIAYGRLLKEKQQLKIENAMLKGDLTATAEANSP